MSKELKQLHDYLAKSPSVVFPQDVLELLKPVEDENERLRELCIELYGDLMWLFEHRMNPTVKINESNYTRVMGMMRDLGIEIDERELETGVE